MSSQPDSRRSFVKSLAGLSGGAPTYDAIDPLAAALVRAAPDRMLWGTDWPHPLVTTPPWPNDATMLERLALWAPDPEVRRRILVDNPTRLYWAH